MGNTINVTVTGLRQSPSQCKLSNKVLKYDLSILSQVASEAAIYTVRWNFDLGGETLTVPANCVFDFRGGEIKNGTIVWNNTKVCNPYQYSYLDNVTEEGTKIEL